MVVHRVKIIKPEALKVKINANLDKDVLENIDEFLKNSGLKISRSEFLRDVSRQALADEKFLDKIYPRGGK